MSFRSGLLAILFAAALWGLTPSTASANYYTSYVYYPSSSYYYCYYYYKPEPTYTGYRSHHCYYYPSYSTRYVYYYNPYRRVYWGRYDLEEKGYSMLEEKDRKGKIEDIPDAAFPKPSAMPIIPEATETKDHMAAPPPPPRDKDKK